MTAVAFPDGFDSSEGWKKAAEESDKKARDLLESYWEKCVERNVSFKFFYGAFYFLKLRSTLDIYKRSLRHHITSFL